MFPVVGYHLIFRVRSIYQNIVFLIRFSFFHFLNLFPDIEHHLHEVFQFAEAFTFRRLYHQCDVDREGEGRSMITIIH